VLCPVFTARLYLVKSQEGSSITTLIYFKKGVCLMFYLGIDIAKTNHVASLLDDEGQVVLRNIKFTNSKEGFSKLLDSFSTIANIDNILVAMEATGYYWLSVYSALNENGFNVSVFNPFQIKSYRSAYSNRKQKNDILDSILIADYLRVFGSSSTTLPKEDVLALKTLTRYRTSLVENISTLKVQIIALLDRVFPEYQNIFSDTFGVTSKQILLTCPTPEEILKINSLKLSNMLSKASKGRFSKSKVSELKEIAKNSFGIKITGDACSFEIKQCVNSIIFLEQQVEELEAKIEEIYSKLDSHLRTIPRNW